ncbi:MAG: hypothetical protein LBH98_05160 [Chitinispirillales bacterium]|jgi:hypothetical protein|nr:hypothetical protein [Chitinispirillales bacterium]
MKKLLKIILFAFIFGIFISCGSSGENGENANNKEFVFPEQEYVHCYNNEPLFVRFIGNDGIRRESYSVPLSGCRNSFDYERGEYLEGEYLFTISPHILDNDSLKVYAHHLYRVHKHNNKLIFYYEMPNYQNPPMTDTINIHADTYKRFIYKNIELPQFNTRQSFFDFVVLKEVEADYIMYYSWEEHNTPNIISYNIGYFKGNEFLRGNFLSINGN